MNDDLFFGARSSLFVSNYGLLTLFALADPQCELYARVLEEFFGGNRDQKTLELLR